MILEPTQTVAVSPEAFVVPTYSQMPGAPFGVHLNTMVLRSAQPVLFDTGISHVRDSWIETTFSVVDPEDVRWIVVTHDDIDHVGNLNAAAALCPNATIVVNWFICERMGPDLEIDPRRLRWVGADEQLDIGDRVLNFVRPPLYDSPTTRVIVESKTGILWGGDLFATPVPQPTDDARDLDPEFLRDGFLMFHRWNSPWYENLDVSKYLYSVEKLAALGVRTVASTHGPVFRGATVSDAFDLLRQVPDEVAPPQPDQHALDAMLAQILAAPVA